MKSESVRRMTSLGLALAASCGACFAAAPSAGAAVTSCNGVLTGTITGDVTVSAGATCTIHDATVNGPVRASGDGAGLIINDSTVNGSILVNGIKGTESVVAVCGTTVKGTVTVKNTTVKIFLGDETRETDLEDPCLGGPDTIFGSVLLSGNATDILQLAGSVVRGSVSVKDNRPGPEEGEEDFANNTIGGAFTCSGNSVTDDAPHTFGSLFDISGTTARGGLLCSPPTDLNPTP